MSWSIHHGEAWEWLRSLPSSSADALVTDPPYSSGGFTRGDRMADPVAKYRDSGAHNLVSSGRVPRGREVETPAVLRVLPLRPPGRR